MYDISAHDTSNGYVDGAYLESNGSTSSSNRYEVSEYIEIVPETTYTINGLGSYNAPSLCFYDADKQYISGIAYSGRSKITFTAPQTAMFCRITHIKSILDTMLNTGSTALPYEPYGYKIPITLAGQTQTIYLSEPLRKALDGSDAVDVLRSDGTLTREVDSDGNALQTPTAETVTVPTLTPTKGSNTISIGTTLQPSEVSITGGIK